MSQQNADTSLSEVYAYANSVGITPQQVDAAISGNTALRERLISWKYLLHSLVNTGYTPWLVGDGNAYIDTGIYATNATTTKLLVKSTAALNNGSIFGARSSATIDNYGCLCGAGLANSKAHPNSYSGAASGIGIDYYNYQDNRVVWDFTPNTAVFLQIGKVSKINDTAYTWGDYTFTTPHSLLIFYLYNAPSGFIPYKGGISYIEIVGQAKFVPYCDIGTYGMLDLVSGNFFGSAVQNGLFSYTLEDSNGNAVNIT